jgi:pseudouridine kinase
LKVNRDEAKAITDLPQGNDEDLIQALLALGVKNVLLSLGSDGVIFANATTRVSHGVFAINAVSDTGAGDALFAGFIHAQLNAWPIEQALEFASACSAMTLESDSANNPNISQKNIEKWIAKK